MRLRARIAIALCALFVVGPAATVPAHAALPVPTLSDVLSLSGCADVTPPIGLGSSTGSFSTGPCNAPFDAATYCVGMSDPGVPPEEALEVEPPINCAWTVSGGSYNNIVCGTGFAGGFLNIAAGPESGSGPFSIVFVAGEGVSASTAVNEGDSQPGTAAGTVSIIPSGGNCDTGITQFFFVGNAAIFDAAGSG
jgi:hypothetical protein